MEKKFSIAAIRKTGYGRPGVTGRAIRGLFLFFAFEHNRRERDAAVGIQTTLHYTTELDNPANKEFVAAWKTKFNATPAVFSVQMWDAANVLYRALATATGLDGDSLATAMASVGTIDDSPRGAWSFSGQTPKQKFYLRKVDKRDGRYVNTVVAELGDLTQDV